MSPKKNYRSFFSSCFQCFFNSVPISKNRLCLHFSLFHWTVTHRQSDSHRKQHSVAPNKPFTKWTVNKVRNNFRLNQFSLFKHIFLCVLFSIPYLEFCQFKMEPTQNDEEQILQQQLDETKEQLRRSVVLNKELKIERERLMLENYTLIRQNSQLKNQLNEVKSHAVTVTQVASNFQRVVNGLLPDFHEQHEKAQGHAKPIVQVTPKPAVQMAKVPVSAVPANVQRPTIVEMSPGQMLQIKQKGNIHGQLVDSGEFFSWFFVWICVDIFLLR